MTGAEVKVAITGARGRMGRVVVAAVDGEGDLSPVAVVSREYPSRPAPGEVPLRCSDLERALDLSAPQVVVDFTSPPFSMRVIAAAHARGIRPVVGTTGFTADDLTAIAASCARHRLPAIVVPNFSLGSLVLTRLAREASRYLPAAEIIEFHHSDKRDAPSGTALRLASELAGSGANPARADRESPARGQVASGVPVHSVRLPGMVAHHEVVFGGRGEYLVLRHDSTSRECFLPGLFLAVRRVEHCQGLVRSLEELLAQTGDTAIGPGS
ncbi:MAG TPA: 4-hydroxy-tetrahydrodipicolinate reductase [Clostridiales bacterium]|nr:4-hydroxy-tetrahydrodipicolinate reductase [Clostridiales bacterium]